MLAGVLLHVIEAAGPVETSADVALGQFAVNNVDDVLVIVTNVKDAGVFNHAEIVGLAAGSGIEGGAVKDDFPGGKRAGRTGEGLGGNTV